MSLLILANVLLAGSITYGIVHMGRPLGTLEYETRCANRFKNLMTVSVLLDVLAICSLHF